MDRRTYLVTAGVGASALLAGCVSELQDDDSETSEPTDEDDEHGAIEVVEAYIEAVSAEDLDAMAETMHSEHPLNPNHLDEDELGEDGWSFEFDAIDSHDVELVEAELSASEIDDLPNTEFWFEEVDLDELVEGEDAALVAVETESTEDGETVTDDDRLVTLTEDGDWTVFFEYEEPPEIPDDEPIEDDAYRIVDQLVFDTESEVVTIELIDSIEADISEMVAYSESLQTDSSIWQEEPTEGFPFTSFSSGFDPDGDTIVVTAIEDGEEVVVHRETYEP